jgi:hypothetical protein
MALRKLYKDRWHIEMNFKNIKSTTGMETLSCRTPSMVKKEMWIYLLAYNLIRLLMVQSALLADIKPRQISFKRTVQLWIAWQGWNDEQYSAAAGWKKAWAHGAQSPEQQSGNKLDKTVIPKSLSKCHLSLTG